MSSLGRDQWCHHWQPCGHPRHLQEAALVWKGSKVPLLCRRSSTRGSCHCSARGWRTWTRRSSSSWKNWHLWSRRNASLHPPLSTDGGRMNLYNQRHQDFSTGKLLLSGFLYGPFLTSCTVGFICLKPSCLYCWTYGLFTTACELHKSLYSWSIFFF